MGYNLLINGVYWGYNPLTNLLLTSWAYQLGSPPSQDASHMAAGGAKRPLDSLDKRNIIPTVDGNQKSQGQHQATTVWMYKNL